MIVLKDNEKNSRCIVEIRHTSSGTSNTKRFIVEQAQPEQLFSFISAATSAWSVHIHPQVKPRSASITILTLSGKRSVYFKSLTIYGLENDKIRDLLIEEINA